MVTVCDPLLLFCSGFSGPGPENEFVVNACSAEPPVPVRIRIVGPCTVYTKKYHFYPLCALWMCSYCHGKFGPPQISSPRNLCSPGNFFVQKIWTPLTKFGPPCHCVSFEQTIIYSWSVHTKKQFTINLK